VGRGDGRDKSVAGVPHSLHEEEGKIVKLLIHKRHENSRKSEEADARAEWHQPNW
jgi:hypothetical protein